MQFKKRAAPKKSDGHSSDYLKVDDGKSVTGVFRGEIFEFYQSWPQGGDKQVFDKPTAGASLRFKANFVVNEGGKYVAKVWEFGLVVYNTLAEIADNFPIETTKIKISRRGLQKDTQWTIIPLGAVDAKALKAIEAVPLNILGEQAKMDPGNVLGAGLEDEDETIPF